MPSSDEWRIPPELQPDPALRLRSQEGARAPWSACARRSRPTPTRPRRSASSERAGRGHPRRRARPDDRLPDHGSRGGLADDQCGRASSRGMRSPTTTRRGFGLVQALRPLDAPALPLGDSRRVAHRRQGGGRRSGRALALPGGAGRGASGIRRVLGVPPRRCDLHRARSPLLGRHGADRSARRPHRHRLAPASASDPRRPDGAAQHDRADRSLEAHPRRPFDRRPGRTRRQDPGSASTPRRTRTTRSRSSDWRATGLPSAPACAPAIPCSRSPATRSHRSLRSTARSGRSARRRRCSADRGARGRRFDLTVTSADRGRFLKAAGCTEPDDGRAVDKAPGRRGARRHASRSH